MDRDEILRVLRAFEAAGLEYVLIGATAMGFHGVVRATEDIDLVITDMIMPVMGGQELYDALRERETAVPVIIISGYVTEEERRDLGKHSQVFWMPKPPNFPQLAALLAQLLPSPEAAHRD